MDHKEQLDQAITLLSDRIQYAIDGGYLERGLRTRLEGLVDTLDLEIALAVVDPVEEVA